MYPTARRIYPMRSIAPSYDTRKTPVYQKPSRLMSSRNTSTSKLSSATPHTTTEDISYTHSSIVPSDPSSRFNSSRKQTVSQALEETEDTSRNKRWLIPIIVVLSIVSALALAALGIVIYTLITLNKNLATTTTTTVASSWTLNWETNATTVVGESGVAGNDTYHLDLPCDIALDSTNTIYVADSGNNRVQKQVLYGWNSATVLGYPNGTSGTDSDALSNPYGIVLDGSTNLYVTDGLNNRVQFLYNCASSASTVAGNFTAGTSLNELNNPYGIARDPNSGIIYVSDSYNHRVLSFSPGSSVGVLVAGGYGQGLNSSQLNNPQGLFFDAATNSLIIANSGANNVVRWVLGESSWTLVAGSSSGISGASSTLLQNPFDVILDSMNNIYVADTSNHRIQLFSSGTDGLTIAGVSGQLGNASNYLNSPVAIALDSQLNLYVSDRNNHRIQRFARI